MKGFTLFTGILLIIFFCAGCSDDVDRGNFNNNFSSREIWFKQAGVDLGHKIKMINDSTGAAISRGKGDNVKGKVYQFKKGKWIPIDQFDYSDYPQIAIPSDNFFYYVTHSTHLGFYKPHLYKYAHNKISEIALPKVMWDEIDYSMWNGFAVLPDGKAWMVGQQGNIIYFDGIKWNEQFSPVKRRGNENLTSGDLHDIQMLSDTSGWAVGKQGIILRYTKNGWRKLNSPTNDELKSVSMINDTSGWIVGDRGTILRFKNNQWKKYPSNIRVTLNSVKALDDNHVWAVGGRSTLISFDNGKWFENNNVKTYEDLFNDIAVVKDRNGDYKIWIIGDNGIYTNSQNLKFSFTDITSQASLRKDGRVALFQDLNNDFYPEAAILLEGSHTILHENVEGNFFREISRETTTNNVQTAALGDFNNDGENDIIEIGDDTNYRMMFGKGDLKYRNVESADFLKLNFMQTDLYLTAIQQADFDNDGNLDLYISNYNYEDMLFKNDGTGRFINVFHNTGIKKLLDHRSYCVTLSDYDMNGLVDVLISYKVPEKNQHLFMFLNKGNFKFVEKVDSNFTTRIAPSTYSAISNDFNNDGLPDIVVFNNGEKLKFLVNKGDANFVDVADEIGFTEKFNHPEPSNGLMNCADVNNDGWLDFFIGSKLFLNSSEFKFSEIGNHTGVDFLGNPSFADFDNDGDMDLFIGSSRLALGSGDRAVLYRNNLVPKNYLKVALEPDLSNRNGIGTKMFLEGYDKKGKLRYKTIRQVGLGGSAAVQQNFSCEHFGINPGWKYNLLVVFPSGIQKKIQNVESYKELTVAESSFPNHTLILIGKSLNRTLLLINPVAELIKFVVMFFVFVELYLFGIRTKAKKIVKKWYPAVGFILLYLVLTHLSINEKFFESFLFSVGVTGSTALGFIFIVANYVEKKESKYISHYKLIEIIGVGGMGKVFKAIDTQNGRIVALKVLNPHLLREEENKKRLASEGRLLSSLNHDSIIKVYEFGEAQRHTFIAMEYLSGGTLDEFIQKNFPLNESKFLDITKQICDGLSAIHLNNIVHRDLKSQNIMFDKDGKIKIMDFGLSKSPLVTTMTSLGTIVGTLGYVAPEQITNMHVDHRTDIFSLGVILYQMISGKLPFKGENEMALIHSIFNMIPEKPSALNSAFILYDEIVLKCLSKNPEERFSSADEILDALKNIEKK